MTIMLEISGQLALCDFPLMTLGIRRYVLKNHGRTPASASATTTTRAEPALAPVLKYQDLEVKICFEKEQILISPAEEVDTTLICRVGSAEILIYRANLVICTYFI